MEPKNEFMDVVKEELTARDEKNQAELDKLHDALVAQKESMNAFMNRQKTELEIPHKMFGTRAKGEIVANWFLINLFKGSNYENSDLCKDASEKLEAAADYSLGTGTGLEWARWEYSQKITDLQTRFGLLRKLVNAYQENLKGVRGVDFPTKTGTFDAQFLSEIAAARTNAVTNTRTLGVTTVNFKAIAAYAYITRLAVNSDRLSILDSVMQSHALGISRREDWTSFRGAGTNAALDGLMQGIIPFALANARFTALANGVALTWDHLLDAIPEISNVVRDDIGNLGFGMNISTWNYLRKLKNTVGTYLVKDLQDSTVAFRNLDGIKIETGTIIPAGIASETGYIVLTHNTEALKFATGEKLFQAENMSLAPEFSTGVGAYEEYCSTVVGGDALWVISFDGSNV